MEHKQRRGTTSSAETLPRYSKCEINALAASPAASNARERTVLFSSLFLI